MQKQKLSDDAGSKNDQAASPTTPEVIENAGSTTEKKPATRFIDLRDIKGCSLDNLPGPFTPRPKTDEDEFEFDRSK